jgi:N-acetyl-anhydromuramyl-L-alanine amidase AmpD
VLKLGDKNENVLLMQKTLKEKYEYPVELNSHYDDFLYQIIVKFQKDNDLGADGVVGSKTWTVLLESKDTSDPKVEDRIVALEWDEYSHSLEEKNQIFLHHTSGSASGVNVVSGWEHDANKYGKVYRVATSYIISREYKRYGQDLKDGEIIKTFNPKFAAWHLGGSANSPIEKTSIGIEICSYGGLIVNRGGQFQAWTDSIIPEEEVYEHPVQFRGYSYFQKYTDAQIESTYKILKELQKSFDIKIQDSFDTSWFEYNPEVRKNLPGIWTHTNVRTDKHDCFPQPELIQMLNSL